MTKSGPLWLIAVDGEDRGDAHQIELDQAVSLGPGQTVGPFRIQDEGLSHPLRGKGRANLFRMLSETPLRVDDVVEFEGQMWLVSDQPPSWPESLAETVEPFLEEEEEEDDLGGEFDETQDQRLSLMPFHLWLNPPVTIPRIFHSEYHEGAFSACLICDTPLLEGAVGSYMVEKIYRGQEVILECAVCQRCAVSMNCELSEESRENLEAFSLKLLEHDASLQRCRVCCTARDQLDGFNIITAAILDRVLPDSWVLLCSTCIDEMETLLSKKTTEIYSDFVEDNFPGIPHDIDAPRPVFI